MFAGAPTLLIRNSEQALQLAKHQLIDQIDKYGLLVTDKSVDTPVSQPWPVLCSRLQSYQLHMEIWFCCSFEDKRSILRLKLRMVENLCLKYSCGRFPQLMNKKNTTFEGPDSAPASEAVFAVFQWFLHLKKLIQCFPHKN